MPLSSTLAKKLALESGFDLAGVSAVEGFRELNVFPEWIAEGRAGDMRYLEARNDSGDLKRSSLKNAVPWAQSVIVCALNYNSAEPYSTEATDPTRGWISRYAWSKADYHDVILEKLRRLESHIAQVAREDAQDFRSWSYVDTGPLIERVYAKYAGIGWIAKNTCIINQELGSWLFLGVILISLPLTPDLPAVDRCGTCTRCLDACPTNAFPAPYEMDATRCIAYLTIEKRGPMPEDLRAGVGNNIYGCDICQDVCPWNNKDAPGVHAPGVDQAFRPASQPTSQIGASAPGRAGVYARVSPPQEIGASAPEVTTPNDLSSRAQSPRDCSEGSVVPSTTTNQPFSTPTSEPALKGHGFSRAETAPDTSGALAPEVRSRPISTEPAIAPRPELVNPSLDWLAAMDIEEFRRVFRGSPIKRAKFSGVRRNVVTAMGNSGRLEFIPRLLELARDEDATVAEHARWALRQLEQKKNG